MLFRLKHILEHWKNFVPYITIFGLRIGGIAFSYIFASIVTSFYGNETWGVFTLTISIMSIAVLFGKFGFDAVMLKYSSQNHNDFFFLSALMKKVGLICFLISVSFTFVFYFFAEFIAIDVFHNNTLFSSLRILSICVFPYACYLVFSEILRGQGWSFDYTFLQSTGLYGFASIFLIFFAWPNTPKILDNISWSFVLSVFLLFTYGAIRFFRIPKSFSFKNETPSFSNLIGMGWPLFLSNASIVLFEWSDTLLLGYFGGITSSMSANAAIGSYNICYKLSNFVNIPLIIINSLMASSLGVHFKESNTAQIQDVLKKNAKLLFYSTIAVSILVMILSPVLFDFFRIEFNSDNFIVLAFLVGGHFINNFSGPTDLLLILSGNEKKYQQFVMVSVLLNLSVNLLLIPILGSLGSAIANIIFRLSWNLLSISYIHKRMKLTTFYIP